MHGWIHVLGADFKDIPGKANEEKREKLDSFYGNLGKKEQVLN